MCSFFSFPKSISRHSIIGFYSCILWLLELLCATNYVQLCPYDVQECFHLKYMKRGHMREFITPTGFINNLSSQFCSNFSKLDLQNALRIHKVKLLYLLAHLQTPILSELINRSIHWLFQWRRLTVTCTPRALVISPG